MCPACRAFISASDRVCPYCESALEPPRRPSVSSFESSFHLRFASTLIMLINLGIYVATALYSMKSSVGSFASLDAETLYLFGAKYGPAIRAGEWWRLVTAGFLHGGLLHILMNSWALFSLTTEVEALFGTRRFLVMYFFCIVAGFAASTWWSPALSIGSSPGILGLLGVLIATLTRNRSGLGQIMRQQYILWAVYGVAIGFLPGLAIDNAAHLGGLGAGLAAGFLIAPSQSRWPTTERLWTLAAAICILLTVLAFLAMVMQFVARTAG